MTTMTEQPIMSPFLERTINQEHLPYHFVRLLEWEMKGRKKSVRVDLNKLYEWNPKAITKTSYALLRSIVLKKNVVSPILEHDVMYGQTSNLIDMAQLEYEYQRRQVKKGKRKHIQVDFNVLYC
jgi:hypothetical protein